MAMVKHNYQDAKDVRCRVMQGVTRKEYIKTTVRLSRMPQSRNRSEMTESSKKSRGSKPLGRKKIVEGGDISDSSEVYSSSDTDSGESFEYAPSSPKRAKHSHVTNADTNGETDETKDITTDEWSEDEYCVEKIVDMKRDKSGRRFFFIKWLNYPSDENTWEPIENLEKCPEIIEAFLENYSNNNHASSNKKKKSSTKKKRPGTKFKSGNSKSTKEVRKDVIRENGIRYPNKIDSKDKKVSVVAPVQKVVGFNIATSQKQNNEQIEQIPEDMKSKVCQESENPSSDTYIRIPHAGDLFYIRVIDVDGQVNWVYVDMREPLVESDVYYKCVVTEDLTGKHPKLIYGATTAVNGEKFCLVQFEGYSYVEVIPPDNFFLKFPTFKKFFELHCPHIFSTS